VSVFPLARDEQGSRQPDHLAFEIVGTERLNHAGGKAEKLIARGVRRVFAIDLPHARALEWTREHSGWAILSNATVIVDLCLAAPLPISALVDAAKTDDAVATALLTKENPVLVKALEQALDDGKRQALIVVLTSRGFTLTDAQRSTIYGPESRFRLDRWLQRAGLTSVDEILDCW
jgi:hypothetical protein